MVLVWSVAPLLNLRNFFQLTVQTARKLAVKGNFCRTIFGAYISVLSILWDSYSKKSLKYEGISKMVIIRDMGYVIFVQNSFALNVRLINIFNIAMEMDHLFV